MKRLFSATAIREADQKAFSSLHISGTTLMENAGRNATAEVLRHFPEIEHPLILVGPGNNGGDGLVMARHFLVRGITPSVILSRDSALYRGDSLENLLILREILPRISCSDKMKDPEIDNLFLQCDIIIDALLGTGAAGATRGEVQRLIQRIPRSRPVVSIDVPSGVDATSGESCPDTVRADLTLTLLASKPGLHVYPGAGCAGKVHVCDIGIPPASVLPNVASSYLLNRRDLASLLPSRDDDIHKGKRGNLLIMGGSACFRGAVALACKGALRAGTGVVVAAVPEQIAHDLSALVPEAVVFPVPSSDGYLPEDSIKRCLKQWGSGRFNALVLGPGLGRTPRTAELTLRAWSEWEHPLLVDADALYCLAHVKDSPGRREDAVLTPHEGEAATVSGTTSETVRRNRLGTARTLSTRWGNVLLKGPGSIIDDGSHRCILDEGHPCLSVPGSGDVLSGAIGAFLATREIPPFEACLAGSLLHATAGSQIGSEVGCDGTLASEIAGIFPRILAQARAAGSAPHGQKLFYP